MVGTLKVIHSELLLLFLLLLLCLLACVSVYSRNLNLKPSHLTTKLIKPWHWLCCHLNIEEGGSHSGLCVSCSIGVQPMCSMRGDISLECTTASESEMWLGMDPYNMALLMIL